LRFGPGQFNQLVSTAIQALKPNDAVAEHLEGRVVAVWTGELHVASPTHRVRRPAMNLPVHHWQLDTRSGLRVAV
jgi:hypothetical protein